MALFSIGHCTGSNGWNNLKKQNVLCVCVWGGVSPKWELILIMTKKAKKPNKVKTILSQKNEYLRTKLYAIAVIFIFQIFAENSFPCTLNCGHIATWNLPTMFFRFYAFKIHFLLPKASLYRSVLFWPLLSTLNTHTHSASPWAFVQIWFT